MNFISVVVLFCTFATFPAKNRCYALNPITSTEKVDGDIVIEKEIQRIDTTTPTQTKGKTDAIAVDAKEDVKPESASEMAAIESTELNSQIDVVEKESNATKPTIDRAMPGAMETIEIVNKKKTLLASGQSTNSTIGSSETKSFNGSEKILTDGKGNAQKTALNIGRFLNNYRKMYRPHQYRKNSHNYITSNIDSILHQGDWIGFNMMRPWLH
ncbi:hypothetical protein ACOME3_000509 [Neoechinorhynchus agilis]